MAALTADDLTVTRLSDRIENKVRVVRAAITIPTTGNYPTDGIPMPPAGAYGFRRNLDHVQLDSDNTGSRVLATIHKYDLAANTLRVYIPSTGAELATTLNGDGGGTASTLYVTAYGW